MSDKLDAEAFLCYVSALEFVVAIITAILNMYFTLRINQLSTFSPNLRTILTVEAILASILPFLHLATYHIPEHLHSFKDGNYVSGVAFYLLMALHQVVMVVFESKYLLIALERWVAYLARRDYENRGSELAYRLFLINLLIGVPILLFKWTSIWMVFDGAPMDLRLRRTFVLENYNDGLIPSYLGGFVLIFSAIAIFLWLNSQVSNCETYANSLSESYEIRQTKAVLHYVKSLLASFIILICLCGVGLSTIAYLKSVSHLDDDSAEFKIVFTFLYMCLSVYNFIAMLYMIRSFPQLQTVIIKDFPFLDSRGVAVHPAAECDHAEAGRMYFQQLRDAWDTK
ncbi:unnamed protein product [Bursaphelenchus xylophilus]|uniref:(pine wood nematode) hypothetical protein n=1 Tax=Bursaphelenchus xylophilus TaxID=6326 RepID=A0A1I7RIN3_BURXY|nr:unnamed protein product [Bursaphelenchus xylophilus]CAG9118942.1 unnamed protein product [Bursaphelenchus xylophilus]